MSLLARSSDSSSEQKQLRFCRAQARQNDSGKFLLVSDLRNSQNVRHYVITYGTVFCNGHASTLTPHTTTRRAHGQIYLVAFEYLIWSICICFSLACYLIWPYLVDFADIWFVFGANTKFIWYLFVTLVVVTHFLQATPRQLNATIL